MRRQPDTMTEPVVRRCNGTVVKPGQTGHRLRDAVHTERDPLSRPFRALVVEWGVGGLVLVVDLTAVRASVVSAIEDCLQVDFDAAVSRKQRNVDQRQILFQPDRIDMKILRHIELMATDVIVENANLMPQPVNGHCRCVRPVPQQIDLDEVRAAVQDFLLLLQIQFPSLVARRLI